MPLYVEIPFPMVRLARSPRQLHNVERQVDPKAFLLARHTPPDTTYAGLRPYHTYTTQHTI